MVTSYVADDGGRMIPERPRACPAAPTNYRCRIVVEHWRQRKTGPAHPVLVVACRDHARAFTLYPCGHVPYGRVAIAPVREDGAPLKDANWSVTLFAAALDAREDKLWPRDAAETQELDHVGHSAHRRTQGRWLDRAEAVLSLQHMHTGKSSEPIVGLLDLPTLEIRDAHRSIGSKRRSQERGALVADLIARISIRAEILDAILIAGALAEEWGPPIRWEHWRQRRRFLLPQPGAPP